MKLNWWKIGKWMKFVHGKQSIILILDFRKLLNDSFLRYLLIHLLFQSTGIFWALLWLSALVNTGNRLCHTKWPIFDQLMIDHDWYNWLKVYLPLCKLESIVLLFLLFDVISEFSHCLLFSREVKSMLIPPNYKYFLCI